MIIFWTNFGGGRAQGGFELLPLMLFLVPMIFNLLFGGGGYSSSYVYDNLNGWSRVEAEDLQAEEEESLWPELITFLAFISLIVVGFVLVRQAMQRNAARQGMANGNQAQRRTTGTHAERLAAAATLIQKLPIEIYHTKEELEGLSIGELKDLLIKSGRESEAALCIEKRDLVGALLEGSNSSAESCSICVEDYGSGDCLRILPCGHRFHLECIDRWFLSSTDYSRPASCPMCNAEILSDPPQTAAR